MKIATPKVKYSEIENAWVPVGNTGEESGIIVVRSHVGNAAERSSNDELPYRAKQSTKFFQRFNGIRNML